MPVTGARDAAGKVDVEVDRGAPTSRAAVQRATRTAFIYGMLLLILS